MSLTLPESIRSNFDDAVTRIETSIGVAKEYLQKQIDQLIIDDQLANQLKIFIDSADSVISGGSIGQEVLSEEIALSLAVNYSYEEGIYFYLKLPDIPADVLSSLKTGFLLVGGVFGALLDLQLLVKEDDKTLLDIGLTLSTIKTDSDTGEVTFKLTQSTPEEYEVKKVAKSFRDYIIENIAEYDAAVAKGFKALERAVTDTITTIEQSEEVVEGLKSIIAIYNQIIDQSHPPIVEEEESIIYSANGVTLMVSITYGASLSIEVEKLPSDVSQDISVLNVLSNQYTQRANLGQFPIKIQDADGETLIDSKLKFNYIADGDSGTIYLGELIEVISIE